MQSRQDTNFSLAISTNKVLIRSIKSHRVSTALCHKLAADPLLTTLLARLAAAQHNDEQKWHRYVGGWVQLTGRLANS